MNVLDAIQQRRAVKHFDPEFQLSQKDKKQLIENVMQNAPSAFN